RRTGAAQEADDDRREPYADQSVPPGHDRVHVSRSRVAMWQLKGRNALVTGGTQGIGAAIAEELRGLGANVLVVARKGGDVRADVTTAEGRARIVAAVNERGPLHVLVHNAGGNVRGKLVSYDDATIQNMIALNLTAPVLLSRDLHPQLRAAGGTSVIHVG